MLILISTTESPSDGAVRGLLGLGVASGAGSAHSQAEELDVKKSQLSQTLKRFFPRWTLINRWEVAGGATNEGGGRTDRDTSGGGQKKNLWHVRQAPLVFIFF